MSTAADPQALLAEELCIGMHTHKEIIEMGNIEGPAAIQKQVTNNLTGLAEVSVERARKHFKALGEAYKENDDEDFCEARSCVLEESDNAEEMTKIDGDLLRRGL